MLLEGQGVSALAATVVGLAPLDLVVTANRHLVLAALAAVEESLALYRADIETVGGTRRNPEHFLHDDLPFPTVRPNFAKQLEYHQVGHFVRYDFIKKGFRVLFHEYRIEPYLPALQPGTTGNFPALGKVNLWHHQAFVEASVGLDNTLFNAVNHLLLQGGHCCFQGLLVEQGSIGGLGSGS